MANPFDAASRLAEAQPAVDDVEEYVAACHRLGYQHPDLTMHATQVRDWYASEDGLDLRALDADRAVLATVAAAAEDAARTQTDLVGQLSAAWSGTGAAAAHEFVWRSGQAAGAVSVAIRGAADAAATLRDALWRAVDSKVATVEAIDGRHQPQRAQWLAAAKTVTSGAGDLAAASELIDQQVKPFVDADIGSEWLAAMRTANASIKEAYATALASTTAVPPAVFDVPGELGPRAEAPEHPVVTADSGPPPAVQTVPAAAVTSAPTPGASWSGVVPPAAPWSGTVPAGAQPLGGPAAQAPAASLPAASPSTPSLGELGGGTSSLGTGLSGFGQQLADLIGGLVGSADEGLPDPADVDGPDEPDDLEEPDDLDDPDELDELDEPEEPEEPTPEEPTPEDQPAGEGAEEVADEGQEGCAQLTEASAPEPIPAPTPVEPQPDRPPPPQPMPEAVAEASDPTPCEIAADELPQVGE